MVPVPHVRLGIWPNNALQLRRPATRQPSQSPKTNDGVKKQFNQSLGELQMQTREKTKRFFSIELHSKHQIKNMILTNNGQKESTLIEGTIGSFVEAIFTEGIILEVTGTEGVLRLDLQEQEIKRPPTKSC
jgi:hypothetical protein